MKPVTNRVAVLAVGILVSLAATAGAEAVPLAALEQLPVQEITVFKDGHAFVLHEGELPVNASGNVEMDYLPRPVVGTFWPYVTQDNARLRGVVAGQRRVKVERTALQLREMLEANVGRTVELTESSVSGLPARTYTATVIGFPTRSTEELSAASPPYTPEAAPVKGNIVLLRTEEGTRAVPVDRIVDVTFQEPPATLLPEEEFRNLLTLKLDWDNEAPGESAQVGLMYLERGIRWIPSYKVTIDGNGRARVELQATLINELVDLENVTANLVIGVPSFMFKETVDPISLQAAVAQLSQHFRQDSQYLNISNAMMTQAVVPREARVERPPLDLGPEVGDSGKNEDLYMFTVRNLTLEKGERMVLPVTQFELAYRDVFTLDLPFMPSPELARTLNTEQQREMARLLAQPQVEHKLRLTNTAECPLTTAPALILRDGRLLAQGMMTYGSTGSDVDLKITSAIDVKAKVRDQETKRTPDAFQLDHNSYCRVDMAGAIHLTNLRTDQVDLEVSRYVLGHFDEAGQGGKAENGNLFDYETRLGLSGGSWSASHWPSWYHNVNGAGRASWQVALEPGKSVDLTYQWHYFWR
jgi:hypothetical protein